MIALHVAHLLDHARAECFLLADELDAPTRCWEDAVAEWPAVVGIGNAEVTGAAQLVDVDGGERFTDHAHVVRGEGAQGGSRGG